MVKKYRSEALGVIHESMNGLHEIGLIGDSTMQGFEASCATTPAGVIDLKHYIKCFKLTLMQKRLFNSICLDPTAHLYSKEYLERHSYLSRGSIPVSLKKLKDCGLVVQDEAGIWRVKSSSIQKWYSLLLEGKGSSLEAEELRFAKL